ncbi:MAG: hypothetical protein OES38_23655, partial [Gammaproteobacteria bacterium]|nr:hypothetical protein [Gammaproteobacteria bacterium]
RVEIFDNDIGANQTANVLITSYFSAEYSGEREQAASFDPYPETIFIYGNRFAAGGNNPDRTELEQLRVAAFGEDGNLPDIVWDGISNPDKSGTEFAICVDNGEAIMINIDAGNDYQNVTTEMAGHTCAHDKLSEVTLASR